MKCRSGAVLALVLLCVTGAYPAAGQPEPALNRSPDTYLAAEDTFSFSSGEYDNLQISAPRVSVEEIIQAIGERMESDDNKIESNEFTVLTTMIQRENSQPDCDDFLIYESAVRQRVVRGGNIQTVLLWERERTFKDGELEKEEREEEEFKTEWNEISQGISMAVPFSPGTADQYRYELADRQIVGNNVVYKILFAPKNRFDALPSGTGWVDYSDSWGC